jgi:ribosomal protein L37E
MKKKSSSSVFRRDIKEEVVNSARRGVFDGNPLLATPHQVVCKACGFSQKITYLDYLKSGKFELGETRMIEVSYAAPTLFGLSHAMEKRTPIIMTARCERCGTEISCSPVSLEYLLFTATKQQKLKNMYV